MFIKQSVCRCCEISAQYNSRNVIYGMVGLIVMNSHRPIIVVDANALFMVFILKLHLKPYYGVAGSFLSPPTASQSTLGIMERRLQDWFDDNATDIRSLIHDKNAAHDALLRSPTTRTLCDRFTSIRATVQRK